MPERSELQPGVWDDGEGGIEIDVLAVLASKGIPATRENIDAAAAGLAQASTQLGIPAEVRE
jgi:hypothetical protein